MKNDKVWWIRIERESESLKRRQIGITIPKRDSTHTQHHFYNFLEIITEKTYETRQNKLAEKIKITNKGKIFFHEFR